MNWKEIDRKYTKSFDLFFIWFRGDSKACITKREFLEINDIVMMRGNLMGLYDFFDEQGIYNQITIRPSGKGKFTFKWKIYEDINREAGIIHDSVNNFDKRGEAEEQSFEKSFEIFEQQLNKNK